MHEVIANTLDALSFEIFAQTQQKGGNGGQWSKASAAWKKTPGAFFEQREALARLRASLMNEASSPAAEPTGMYLRRLYVTPAIPD